MKELAAGVFYLFLVLSAAVWLYNLVYLGMTECEMAGVKSVDFGTCCY